MKIATCCYCAARTILKPTARHGHELACGSCGAPLHEMKWLKAPAPSPAPKPKAKRPARFASTNPGKPRKFKRRRKSFLSEVAEEVWDWAEDIFD